MAHIIETARKHRSIQNKTEKEEMIQVTPKIKKEIETLLKMPNTAGKAVYFLRAKATRKRKKKAPLEYPASLECIVQKKVRTKVLANPFKSKEERKERAPDVTMTPDASSMKTGTL